MDLWSTPFLKKLKPARSGWISSPAGQGFMSTQRRADRSTPATKTCHWGPRRWQRTSCTDRTKDLGRISASLTVRKHCAHANRGTAPPGVLAKGEEASLMAPVATNSLQSDYRIVKLFKRDVSHSSQSSPPFGAGNRAVCGPPASFGLSLTPVPSPSGFAPLHPTLPQAPAG